MILLVVPDWHTREPRRLELPKEEPSPKPRTAGGGSPFRKSCELVSHSGQLALRRQGHRNQNCKRIITNIYIYTVYIYILYHSRTYCRTVLGAIFQAGLVGLKEQSSQSQAGEERREAEASRGC